MKRSHQERNENAWERKMLALKGASKKERVNEDEETKKNISGGARRDSDAGNGQRRSIRGNR